MNGGPKVFGIGFHKTATKSLAHALTALGYDVTGPNEVHNPDIARDVLAIARKLLAEHDAFQDNPWPILYRELDAWCPGSRFILTTRPADRWVRSVVGHFGSETTPMREWIYGPGRGAPLGNEALYVERFERHERDVLAYFHDRPSDLLVLRITEGDGWEKLCPFLGKPVPDRPFPRENTADARRREGTWLGRLRVRLRRRLGQV